jgi:hypothetical protein
MIVLIGLDLDLVGLIETENPMNKIDYLDVRDKTIETVTYLESGDKIIELIGDKNNKFYFGIDDSGKKQSFM